MPVTNQKISYDMVAAWQGSDSDNCESLTNLVVEVLNNPQASAEVKESILHYNSQS